MFTSLVRILVKTPVYPHWLEHRKMEQGNKIALQGIRGNVVEVGAGDGSRKVRIMGLFPAIKTYLATDYSSWDGEFERLSTKAARFGRAAGIFMGREKRLELDGVCSATKLPYRTNRFDAHLSFEVLEHIDDPNAYFSEASRVVKKGGRIIFSVPFLYREHTMDYRRFTDQFFPMIAEQNKLKIKLIYRNTGFGTTFAVLANQWLIRRIIEGPLLLRPVLFVISPFYFTWNNVVGWLIDLKPDVRFATRYHVVFRKA